jgi:signal transduction histidine kinase/DNA-binding response OmpR family regulator
MNAETDDGRVEILIVEDSPTQAERLQYVLERHGYRLAIARNGRDALASLARHPPTLVISDVMMPEMNGYELCGYIKRDERLRNLPVILLTSLNDPADVVKGLESGADSFIFKPYDEQYLVARISFTLANRHLRENEGTQMGVEVFFAGRKFFITSDRLQILNLLLSTYEAAVEKNRELVRAQEDLRHLNDYLEHKVAERTAALDSEIAERRQAQHALQAQLARLDLLHRITSAIGERQDLKSIFQVVVRRLEDDLPVDFGCVCMHDATAGTLAVSNVGQKSLTLAVPFATAEQSDISVDHNRLSRCMRGELVYEPDLAVVRSPIQQQLVRGGLRSAVFVPLRTESEVLGLLLVARSQARGFADPECEFLLQLSDHVALAAHQARLHSDLKRAYDDLRQTQVAVLQQERLRALGQIASGVAHDINNAMSPVALYADALLEREQHLSEQGRNYLVTIRRAIEGVTQTVMRMREFCRPREPLLELKRVHLNDLVQQVIDLTGARWSTLPQERGIVISVELNLADGLPGIMGADSEIRDALTNLIFNAVDAMPQGGALSIRTCASSIDGSSDIGDADTVHLEVSDTGIGMDEETKRRCLEPFFTTKGERGTGLGLAMVYGMAQRHEGDVGIDSHPGRGTTVRLSFPVAAARTPTVRLPALRMPASPLRILIVDDDPLLTESLRNVLAGDGHHVTVADGGRAGIDVFAAAQAQGESFAVVITDLGMPYVDGRAVAAAIKSASPTTPVVLLTGWGQRLRSENDVPPNVDRLLDKPPKLNELRAVLGDLTATHV